MAIKREKTTDITGTIDLCKTFSNLGLKLKQEETGQIYGKEVTDTIAGYDENNIPYSRYTYTETNIPDNPDEPTTDLTINDTLEILNEFGVDTSD